jgi:acyl CoA:acetate/3-ketoacid CoA transferase alpha subunit
MTPASSAWLARAPFAGPLEVSRLPSSNLTEALTAKSSELPPTLIFGGRGTEVLSGETVVRGNRVTPLSTSW